MGYRRLLKSYIRHLEQVAGDNFIERQPTEPTLSKRDHGELRILAAEVRREAHTPEARVENSRDAFERSSVWQRSPDHGLP